MPSPRNSLLSIFAAGLCSSLLAPAAVSIDAVYFGQSHVLKPDNANFGLVSSRDALIKVHVVDPTTPTSPTVEAVLTLDGQNLTLPLTGPPNLPASIPDGLGVVQHTYSDSFTAIIPAAWVQPGLDITVNAGTESEVFNNLEIGAPTKVIMTMFDVQYFADTSGDYPAGWQDELEAKWPVAEIELRRLPHVVFRELVIPPRSGVAAARVSSPSDYFEQTGLNFDGEQAAALAWNGALKRAAGRQNRLSLYYINIYNVGAGGQAGGFSGVGNGTSVGILHHELGHSLSLPHWGNSASYPYKGDMHGISAPANFNETHAGPAWAFDLPSQQFIPPTVQANNVGGHPVGTYKVDPMQGGGSGWQEPGYLMNHFSDYSMNQMRNYLEGHVVIWNDTLSSYASWNQAAGDYTSTVTNNGVNYPIERDVDVITVMASISGSNPGVNMVYPPIGPYSTGLIKRFDPTSASDRTEAQSIFAPANGCDVTVKVTQGGVVSHYMLAASWEPGADPLSGGSLKTEGVNLRASDGDVTRVELLLTPDAEINGLPGSPQVLYAWTPLSPDPAGFDLPPTAFGSTSISMTATTGALNVDSTDTIEYRFIETSGNPGGNSSAWQTGTSYTDVGLDPLTQYTYTVEMRAGAMTVSPSTPASATTNSATAVGNITVGTPQPFTLQSGGGLKPVTGLGAFDADGADKLVVVASTEHSFNNGDGRVIEVRYNGSLLTEAVQEDAGPDRGAAAIFYLDNPGPIGVGTIEVSASNPNGGLGAAYTLTGSSPGVGVTASATGDSVNSVALTTAGDNSVVIAVIDNAGNPNSAGSPTATSPLTPVSSGSWGSNWGGHASGWQEVSSPSAITPTFSTNTGAGYNINIAAAEFLAAPNSDYSTWEALYPAADLGNPAGDADGDGLTNDEERLWGLDPTDPDSTNPVSVPFDATGSLTYTRRDESLTGATYSVWYSTTLQPGSWLEDTNATQNAGSPDANGVESVDVTIDPALLLNTELFVRIAATP